MHVRKIRINLLYGNVHGKGLRRELFVGRRLDKFIVANLHQQLVVNLTVVYALRSLALGAGGRLVGAGLLDLLLFFLFTLFQDGRGAAAGTGRGAQRKALFLGFGRLLQLALLIVDVFFVHGGGRIFLAKIFNKSLKLAASLGLADGCGG